MKAYGIAALVIVGALATVRPLAAQDVRGFAGGGTAGGGSRDNYPSFGGGVLVDVGQSWVSAGVQGDGFVSIPYVVGRGTVFAQGHLLPKRAVRPFLLAGRGWGAFEGLMYGGGVEFKPAGRGIGFRASVENYVERYKSSYRMPATNYISMRLAVLFR